MTRRPRPHQIEDQSRHAFARALPPQWVVERVEHDYGLDVWVEIFDEAGRATGQMFFAQIKSTDRLPTRSGISIRIKPAHLAYWNSLAELTMVVVWVAATDTIYWRWAHLHHPWPRGRTPKAETLRFSTRDQWQPVDAADIRAELAFCHDARRGNLLRPLEVRFEDYRHRPLKAADRDAAAGAWRSKVDPSIARRASTVHPAQAVVQLGYRGTQVRLGRAIVSSGLAPAHERSDYTPEELVDEAAGVLGILLCNGGSLGIGLDLIGRHGPRCRFLAVTLSAEAIRAKLPSVFSAIHRSSRFDVGLNLVEAWAASDDKAFVEAAHTLALMLRAFDMRLSAAEAARLERCIAAVPHLENLVSSEVRRALAGTMAEGGFVAAAIEQYEASLQQESAEPDHDTLFRLASLRERAGLHREAAETFAALVHRDPECDEWRRRYGIAGAAAGLYGIALPAFMSITSQPLLGEAWSRLVAMYLVVEAAGEPWQTRQPGGAEAIARTADDGMDRRAMLKLFHEAAAQDALSGDTWRLYFLLAIERSDDLPFGVLGVLPVAVIAWDDPEWWALALSLLMRDAHFEALLRGTECALQAVGDEFVSMIAPEGRLADWCHPRLHGFAQLVATARADGQVLHVRAAPEEIYDQPAVVIERAPEGYRVFEAEPPPLETWCPSEPLEYPGPR